MSDGRSEPKSAGVVDEMLENLIESGEAEKMDGLDIDRLKAAMSAPGAAETVAAIQAMGANSQAGAGQPAPDFELPFLPGNDVLPGLDGGGGERIRLSDRLANLPVALIFGSYT
jgi:hypothetical protein